MGIYVGGCLSHALKSLVTRNLSLGRSTSHTPSKYTIEVQVSHSRPFFAESFRRLLSTHTGRHHMAESSGSDSTKKRTRCATTLAQFTAKRQAGEKYSIEFDEVSGQPIGDNASKFCSYVGMLARSKASILPLYWNLVDGEVKKLLWQDILSLFDMPDDEKLKNRWIAYAGERWRTFKTVLATTYISGDGDKDGNKTPCPKYSYIDEETWQQFVKIRESPEFREKRQKAQQNQSHNDCPHRTSRLGYRKLKGIMKDENLKAMQEEAGDPTLIVDPPSPPRYELWKRARQKPSGGYTSEASASIADKIDSLVQESQQGTFVPSGRQDILTTAIGKPEHPGRVRAAGRGVGIKKYFGGLSRPSSGAIYTEAQLQAFRQGIIEEVTQNFNKQLGKALEERMASFGFSQQDSSPKDAMRVSTKGSCSRAHDEDPEHDEDMPKKNVLTDLAVLAMKHDKDSVKLDLEHEHHEHFFIDKTDIMHLISGDEWLGLSHLSIWCTDEPMCALPRALAPVCIFN